MSIIITIILAILYFLPTYIAWRNKKANLGAIAALNILAGWLIIGWIVAFIWALTKDRNQLA